MLVRTYCCSAVGFIASYVGLEMN